MIPTRSRMKLPKHLSYPAGAEAITVRLNDSSQLKDLSLRFFSRPVEPASRFQRILVECLPYPILVTEYQAKRRPGLSAAGFMIERGWYDERLEMMVYPVLREFRQTAHELLMNVGLPELGRWILTLGSEAQGNVVHQSVQVFNPTEKSLKMSVNSKHVVSSV